MGISPIVSYGVYLGLDGLDFLGSAQVENGSTKEPSRSQAGGNGMEIAEKPQARLLHLLDEPLIGQTHFAQIKSDF